VEVCICSLHRTVLVPGREGPRGNWAGDGIQGGGFGRQKKKKESSRLGYKND